MAGKQNHQGGSNGSLELTLGLVDQRQSQLTRVAELVWSGPRRPRRHHARSGNLDPRNGERCEKRLPITTFNIWRGGFIAELLNNIQQRMLDHPSLDARIVINIPRPRSSVTDQLRHIIHDTWRHLWDNQRPKPLAFSTQGLSTTRTPHRVSRKVLRC